MARVRIAFSVFFFELLLSLPISALRWLSFSLSTPTPGGGRRAAERDDCAARRVAAAAADAGAAAAGAAALAGRQLRHHRASLRLLAQGGLPTGLPAPGISLSIYV